MNQAVVTEDVIAETRQPAQISWGAVFAGWVLANGVAWLLYTLGSAIGLSLAGATHVPKGGMAAGVAIWIFITWLASLFLGGLFAGRLAGKADRAVGAMHGMTVWGLATIVAVALGMMGISSLLQTGQHVVSGAASAATGGAAAGAGAGGGASAAGSAFEDALKSRISEAMSSASQKAGPGATVSKSEAKRAVDQMDPKTLSQISARLMSGDTAGARRLLAANTTLSQAQVDHVINGLTVEGQNATTGAKHVAGKAAEYSALTLGVIFVSSAVGLAMAILGGWLGAGSVSRIYGYRLY